MQLKYLNTGIQSPRSLCLFLGATQVLIQVPPLPSIQPHGLHTEKWLQASLFGTIGARSSIRRPPPFLSCPSSCQHWTPGLPSSDEQSALSTILLCPTQSPQEQEVPIRRQPIRPRSSASSSAQSAHMEKAEHKHTFFLNCLWIASNASLMVTPFRFRAVTSSPNGKWRSIFLTGGSVRCFFRTSLSSSVAGDVLSRLNGIVSTSPCNPAMTVTVRKQR